jgi:peptidoglycan/LPS O-acetylase OafA/YrhL
MRPIFLLIFVACLSGMFYKIYDGLIVPAGKAAGTKEGRTRRILKHIDKRIGPKVGAFLSGVVVVSTFGGIVGYGLYSTAERALEFASYMLPCLGGMVAAFAIYKDECKRLLFVVSLLCIVGGMLCFFGSKVDGLMPWLLSVAFTLPLMAAALSIIYFSSSTEKDMPWVKTDTTIVLVLAFACIFVGFIVFKNTDCLLDKPNCHRFWWTWTWGDL